MSLVKEVKTIIGDTVKGASEGLKAHPVSMGLFVFALVVFLALTVYRMAYGLGVTNVNDHTPWGLWTAFKLTLVVWSGCAFTLTGMVYVLGMERFRPLARSAALVGVLGYSTFALVLVLELGFPWRIIHPIYMWQHHSILFEVAWCVMLYLTILTLEFAPNIWERFKLPGLQKLFHKLAVTFVVLGILLSVLHQSSLGSLFVVCLAKLNPLWGSPWVGPFFILSAVLCGLAMVIGVELFMAVFNRREPRMKLLSELGMFNVAALALYLGFKVMDVLTRPEAFHAFFAFDIYTLLYIFEIGLGILVPIFLYANRRVRESAWGIGFTSLLVLLFGGALNRLNVSVIAYRHAPLGYFPNWVEFLMVPAIFILVVGFYVIISKLFPVYGTYKTYAGDVPAQKEPEETS